MTDFISLSVSSVFSVVVTGLEVTIRVHPWFSSLGFSSRCARHHLLELGFAAKVLEVGRRE